MMMMMNIAGVAPPLSGIRGSGPFSEGDGTIEIVDKGRSERPMEWEDGSSDRWVKKKVYRSDVRVISAMTIGGKRFSINLQEREVGEGQRAFP